MFTFKGFYCGIHHKFHIVTAAEDLFKLRFAAKGVASMDDIDMRASVGKKDRILKRGVAAARDRDGFPLEKGAVAHRAVGDAGAGERFLLFEPKMTVARTRGDDDAPAFIAAVLRDDGFDRTVCDFRDGREFDFGAQLGCLLDKMVGKLVSADLPISGIILHARGIRDLSAEKLLFKNQHAFSRAQSINGGGKPRRPRADNDDILHEMAPFRRRCRHSIV